MSKSIKVAHDLEKKWRSNDVKLREKVDFSALLLSERVLSGLEKAGFKKPSPIQVEAIPLGKFGKDLVVQAKSGTGKTLVFVVVALETLKPKLFRPQVLIIVPTREIATQVCSVIKAVSSKFKKLTCNSFIGGLPVVEDRDKAFLTQIAVGTPGRIKQLIQMKSLPTNSIRLLVFDEADELLSGSCFKEDIEDIFKTLPDDKQVIATSATFNIKVKSMVSTYLSDPYLVNLNRKQLALLGMVHYVKVVDHFKMPVIQYKEKTKALEKILKSIEFGQCLLFVNGISRVEILYRDVRRMGFSAAYMSSAKEQNDRLKAIDKLKRFKCKVLVSSNVTARGIDAENVDLVINFDVAYSIETYMHRVGRAGRYGTIGAAISIIDEEEIPQFESIKREGSIKVLTLPKPIPRDLILNVPESDDESTDTEENTNDNDASSGKDIDVENEQLKDVDGTDNESDNDCSSEKISDAENNQMNDIYKTNVDAGDNACENVSSEPVAQFAMAEINNHGTTKTSVESQIKAEKLDKDDIAYSKNTNVEIVQPKEQASENVKNGCTPNHKLNKTKSNLLNDIDQNELISNLAYDKSYRDVHENPIDLCEKIEIKSNDTKNVVQLDNELSSATNAEKIDLKIDDSKFKEMHIDSVSKTKNTLENDSVHYEQENIVKSGGNLNNIIKTFIDAHESNKEMESTISKIAFDEGNQQNENSGKKFVTIDMINKLKSQNQEFLYETFKNFQESNDSATCKNDIKDRKEESNEDNTELVSEEITTFHSEFKENSECKKVLLEKPHFESTPQCRNKTKQEILKFPMLEACEPLVQDNFINQEFEALPEESEEDFHSDEEISDHSYPHFPIISGCSSVVSPPPSDSESDSESETNTSSHDSSETNSSEDSESDSSSDDSDGSSSTTTTASSVDENIYYHNYSRTGRQNPSLISESVNEHIEGEFDPVYYDRYPRCCKCACCAAPLHYNTPLQSTTRFPHRISEMNDRHKFIHQDTFNSRYDSSFIGRMNANPFLPYCYQGDFSSANKRGGYSDNQPTCSRYSDNQPTCSRYSDNQPTCSRYSVNQPTCSRCYRSKDSRNRGCTMRGGCQKPKHQTSQTNPENHTHTPNCYLPTSHRCHPKIPGYHCGTDEMCEMWYGIFYNQWMHIQNMIN